MVVRCNTGVGAGECCTTYVQYFASRSRWVLLSAAQYFTLHVGGMHIPATRASPAHITRRTVAFALVVAATTTPPPQPHLCHQKLALGIGGRRRGAQVAALPLLGVGEAGPGAVPHDAIVQQLALMRGTVAEQGIPMGG